MPYKSEAQRRYFNANRDKLEAEGVDVDEWNESSKGKKLPEKAEKKSGIISDLFSTGREAQEEHEKEKEKLDKAVARNVRERLARQIAKEKVAMDKEAIGGLLGGLVGAGLGAGKARSLGMPTTHGAEEGFVRGGLTGSAGTIGGGLGLLGSLKLMSGKGAESSTTRKIIASLLPVLGAGAGGYMGYHGSQPLIDSMRKSREGLVEAKRRNEESMEAQELEGDMKEMRDWMEQTKAAGDWSDANAIAPRMAMLGGGTGLVAGGIKGLLEDPGYDEETGHRKSRFLRALRESLKGGAIGAGSLATLPYLATAIMPKKAADFGKAAAWEKEADRRAAVWKLLRPYADSALGAVAGGVASPFTANAGGIDSNAGRLGHTMSMMATGAGLAHPGVRNKLWHGNPWTRKGATKTHLKQLRKLQLQNPDVSSKNILKLHAGNPMAGKVFRPIKGTLLTGSLAAAPATIGAYTDAGKQFAEKFEKDITSEDNLTDLSLSGMAKNTARKILDSYGMDKKWIDDKINNAGAYAGGALAGSVGGGLMGGSLASLLSKTFIDEGNADYKNLDEEGYKKRRRKEKLRGWLKIIGMYGGSLVGGGLGATHLSKLFKKEKKGHDMSHITELAKAAAWYDYLDPRNLVTGGATGRERARGRALDAKSKKTPGTLEYRKANKPAKSINPNSLNERAQKGMQMRRDLGLVRD
jgi:hypothetical protein